MTRPSILLVVLLLAGAPACKCAPEADRRPENQVDQSGEDKSDRVIPVYDTKGPVLPLAAKLCDALHKLPAERRAACCQGGMGFTAAELCAGTLSAALRLGAVTLAEDAVDRCAAAVDQAHQGCAWVGPNPVPVPAACQGVLVGKLARGERCRSGLECQGELRCAGGGPTDPGRCAPAGSPGSQCELAVDTLATYTRQEVERRKPECTAYCERSYCQPPLEGGACLRDAQCPAGSHCAGKTCAPGPFAKEGGPCVAGGCEAPLRCVKGACRAPAPEGTACSVHAECQGACIPGDGGGGKCGLGCAFR